MSPRPSPFLMICVGFIVLFCITMINADISLPFSASQYQVGNTIAVVRLELSTSDLSPEDLTEIFYNDDVNENIQGSLTVSTSGARFTANSTFFIYNSVTLPNESTTCFTNNCRYPGTISPLASTNPSNSMSWHVYWRHGLRQLSNSGQEVPETWTLDLLFPLDTISLLSSPSISYTLTFPFRDETDSYTYTNSISLVKLNPHANDIALQDLGLDILKLSNSISTPQWEAKITAKPFAIPYYYANKEIPLGFYPVSNYMTSIVSYDTVNCTTSDKQWDAAMKFNELLITPPSSFTSFPSKGLTVSCSSGLHYSVPSYVYLSLGTSHSHVTNGGGSSDFTPIPGIPTVNNNVVAASHLNPSNLDSLELSLGNNGEIVHTGGIVTQSNNHFDVLQTVTNPETPTAVMLRQSFFYSPTKNQVFAMQVNKSGPYLIEASTRNTSPSTSTDGGDDSSGISKGAVVGIVVGIIVLVIIIIISIIACCCCCCCIAAAGASAAGANDKGTNNQDYQKNNQTEMVVQTTAVYTTTPSPQPQYDQPPQQYQQPPQQYQQPYQQPPPPSQPYQQPPPPSQAYEQPPGYQPYQQPHTNSEYQQQPQGVHAPQADYNPYA